MSGVFGVCNSQVVFDFDRIGRDIAGLPAPRGVRPKVECWQTANCLMGRTHLAVLAQPPLGTRDAAEPVLVSAGYCIDDSQRSLGWSRGRLDAVGRMLECGDCERLAALNGTFQCARLGADGNILHLLIDRLGLMPLLMFTRPPVFAFAPDLTLLLTLIRGSRTGGEFSPALDRSALAEWLEIGLVMGERTLLRDITVMPAGSVLTWDGQRSRIDRYWRPRFCEKNKPFDIAERGEALDAALRRSLRRRIHPDKRVCVSLSGGLDSRLLLGAAVREGLPVTALTFGPEHSDDHAIASSVAEHLGVAHYRCIDHPDASAGSFDLGVRRSAGMSNVLDLWGLQHGPLIHDTTDILLNGIGGNELLGFLAFDLSRFKIARSTRYLTRWLLRKLNPGWSAADRVLIRQALAPDDPPLSERIETWWRHCPATTPMGRIYHFYLEEKSRKANALGVATDDLFVEPVAPFLDNDAVDLALQIPPHQRLLARFYRGFIQAQYPRLAAIPYSRTGLPVDASASRILLAKLMRKRQVKGRLSESPWDRWLREDLREYVHETLLGDASRLQEILPSEFVHEHVNMFMAGRRVPAMAIGQLLSLASFLKQFRPSLA